MKFPFIRQLNAIDCGPTCLRMISKYYGGDHDTKSLNIVDAYSKLGVTLLDISETAEKIGFRARGVMLNFQQLKNEVDSPCILHWNQNHFVVMLPINGKWNKKQITIVDPAIGFISLSKMDFLKNWISHKDSELGDVGTALLLEPSMKFFEKIKRIEKKRHWGLVFQYLKRDKWQLTQVFIALFITSLFQLIFPFLTQSIVDTGITAKNLHFLTIILLAQMMLVFSRTIIDFIRGRILLGISININFSLLSDFWIKITKLPISYFDRFHIGDTLQRLADSKKIESFLTGSALNTFFSLFSFIVFTIVLALYSSEVLLVFISVSILYYLWISLFLRKRRKINYQAFHLSARENSSSLQLVQGMQELKLYNAENIKRFEWETIQASIFKLSFKNLSYSQLQQAGALFLNEGKNLVITYLVARMVVHGKLTLGSMLSVQYIIGQLSSPIEQFVGFIQNAQDAKISLERLNEIHEFKDEEADSKMEMIDLSIPPKFGSISISNLSFIYPGAGNEQVLRNINMIIPVGKITAIVGLSGSGKTTLLKLLLKFYENYMGEISIDTDIVDSNKEVIQFKYISPSYWRSHCGAVLQDGYIFNDSIAKNIAIGDQEPDYNKLVSSAKMANVLAFVESLPYGFNTRLGTDGIGISQGQKQRILIARAAYKDPRYLFFDEATNALDASNEKVIVENLQVFFKHRTVVVVAHRLSTVKNADKIVVLDEGRIVEEGTHAQLTGFKGRYFELVKNQLELGN